MPIVQVEIMPRTTEQKRAMAKEVTEAICRTLGCPKEAVSIIIREMSEDTYAVAGVLHGDKPKA